MSEEQESRLKRWSRRKSGQEPETEEKPQGSKKQRGAAAPVADRKIAPLMPPLAEPEEGEIEMEAAAPEALALKAQLEAEKAEREEEETEEERELTPEQAEAVAKLPPLESLDKDSDFTPFFADNIPDFLKRQAYRVLWRSNPFFNVRDGLDDYDEDFGLSKLIGNVVSEAKGKTKPKTKTKPSQARADDETAKAAAPEKGVDADNKDTADADGEDGLENAAEDADSDENPSESS